MAGLRVPLPPTAALERRETRRLLEDIADQHLRALELSERHVPEALRLLASLPRHELLVPGREVTRKNPILLETGSRRRHHSDSVEKAR